MQEHGSFARLFSLSLFFFVEHALAVPPTVAATSPPRRLAKRLAVILPKANDQVSRSRATQVDLVSADILRDTPPRNWRSV